ILLRPSIRWPLVDPKPMSYQSEGPAERVTRQHERLSQALRQCAGGCVLKHLVAQTAFELKANHREHSRQNIDGSIARRQRDLPQTARPRIAVDDNFAFETTQRYPK